MACNRSTSLRFPGRVHSIYLRRRRRHPETFIRNGVCNHGCLLLSFSCGRKMAPTFRKVCHFHHLPWHGSGFIRLIANMRMRERVFGSLAVLGSFIGGCGLILLSIFDTKRHPTIHRVFLLIFIVGVALSAIFTIIEVNSIMMAAIILSHKALLVSVDKQRFCVPQKTQDRLPCQSHHCRPSHSSCDRICRRIIYKQRCRRYYGYIRLSRY